MPPRSRFAASAACTGVAIGALGRWAPRTTNAATAAGGPLDPAGAERIRAEFGSTGALGKLVELFGKQTPELLADLRAAIEAGDSQSVRESAHKLKGGCVTLAALHLAELCNALEVRAEADSLEGTRELVDGIEAAFHQAHAALLAEVSCAPASKIPLLVDRKPGSPQ